MTTGRSRGWGYKQSRDAQPKCWQIFQNSKILFWTSHQKCFDPLTSQKILGTDDSNVRTGLGWQSRSHFPRHWGDPVPPPQKVPQNATFPLFSHVFCNFSPMYALIRSLISWCCFLRVIQCCWTRFWQKGYSTFELLKVDILTVWKMLLKGEGASLDRFLAIFSEQIWFLVAESTQKWFWHQKNVRNVFSNVELPLGNTILWT